MGTINSLFLTSMEQILQLYARPYAPADPVLCFDERPCFLIGDKVEPHALQSGAIRKEHYAYEKFGSCALLAAIEPLTGKRCARVYPRRTKQEFTCFCQVLTAVYPEARKIHLVLDNLNTHNASAFYDALPEDEALALANRFQFHYTPKSASWLNMIEIEFSALTRLCLKRRIPTLESLNTKSWPLSTNGTKNGSRFTGSSRSILPEANSTGTIARLIPLTRNTSLLNKHCTYERFGVDFLTDKVYQNRQRTSTRNGILKSEAVLRFSRVLQQHGIQYMQDVYQDINQ